MPVSLAVLESQWEAAFERYRLAVRQFGAESPEAKEQWQLANSSLDDVVSRAFPTSSDKKTSKLRDAA